MRWLLRLLFLRLLGPRAVSLLALLGLVRAFRGRRTADGGSGERRTGLPQGGSGAARR